VSGQQPPPFEYDVSPFSCKEFLGAIDTSRCIKNTMYIAEVMKRYLIEVDPRMLFKYARTMLV
jgi:hypothetical protein